MHAHIVVMDHVFIWFRKEMSSFEQALELQCGLKLIHACLKVVLENGFEYGFN